MSFLSNKEILYKIYESDGTTFITTWKDVASELVVKTLINGGTQPVLIRLARPETQFGENVDVKQGNILRVYVFDRESGVNGVCVFSGILTSYIPTVRGGEEFIEVEFFSQYWDLNNKMLESSGDTEVTYTAQDPSNILKDLLDKYVALPGSVLTYNAGTVELTGNSATYTFNTSTYQQCIEKALELCPEEWYFRIGPDDLVYWASKETDPTHYFTVGGDIMEYYPEKRFDNIINTIYFRGGDTGGEVYLYNKYTNSGSVSIYGTRAIKIVDERVIVAATAQSMANRILNDKNSAEIRVVLKIRDSNGEVGDLGYNIESIFPGQTCKILNATQKSDELWDEATWDVNFWDYSILNAAATQLQIMSVEWHADYAIIELSTRQPDISKRIEDVNNKLVDSQTDDNPATPS